MLELGHLWVIADKFTKSWSKGNAGELIHQTDNAGKFLATALFSPGERIVARILSYAKV